MWEKIPASTLVEPSTFCHAGVESLADSEVRDLIRQQVDAACKGRIAWEHIRAFEVLSEPFR